MEAVSLSIGIVLMLVAALGIVLYVALVIAIPVCRLIDWLSGEEPEPATEQLLRPEASPRALDIGLPVVMDQKITVSFGANARLSTMPQHGSTDTPR